LEYYRLGRSIDTKNEDGREYVVAYASKCNNSVESNYSLYEKETLVVFWAISHIGSPMTLTWM